MSPADWDTALDCLTRLGYVDLMRPPNLDKHARPFRRGEASVVDLHRSLAMVGCTPEVCWDVLSERVQPLRVAGRTLASLDAPALATVLALHAAQHGRAEQKPLDDLERAVEVLDGPTWEDAVAVARRLDAVDAVTAGLHLAPGGTGLARRLGLPDTVAPAVRLRASSAPTASVELARILAAPDRAERRRRMRPIVAPTDLELGRRAWARRVLHWPGGRVLARVVWWARLATEVPAALVWYLRFRRTPRRRSPP